MKNKSSKRQNQRPMKVGCGKTHKPRPSSRRCQKHSGQSFSSETSKCVMAEPIIKTLVTAGNVPLDKSHPGDTKAAVPWGLETVRNVFPALNFNADRLFELHRPVR